MKIGIIGLGYVGLPLCLQFSKSGAQVLGFDVDFKKVESLNNGESYIKHIDSNELQSQRDEGRLEATTDWARVKELDAVLICVPTPLNEHREPDLSFVLSTGRSIASHLPKGITVVLESTTYPGTTEDELKPILEQGSGWKAGEDFYLAYSPEREDPGNPGSQVAKIPKVVGGYTPMCLEKAIEIYGISIKELVPVSNCRTAEATKLLENIFRSVNIALVNELKVIYESMNINVWETIEAAKTKPFGFMPFYPGPGLGGHCIPIDPFYLSWKARQNGKEAQFVELAGKVNTSMPDYVIKKCEYLLKANKKNIGKCRVLIIGLAYKPNVDDDRESPSYVLMEKLNKLVAHVDYYDPYIPAIRPNRKFRHFSGKKSVNYTENSIATYDLVILSTVHDGIDLDLLCESECLIVDTRGALPPALLGQRYASA